MKLYQKEKVQKNLDSEVKKQERIQERQNLKSESTDGKKQKVEAQVNIKVSDIDG